MTQDEALKLALKALELVNIEFVCNGAHHAKKDRHELGDECPVTDRYRQSIIAIKEALSEQEQEPVAWMSEHRFDELRKGFTVMTTLTKQRAFEDDVAFYTTPPQRTWVGLTDDEITELHHEIKVRLMGTYKTEDIYRAIEAKLKDKNR